MIVALTYDATSGSIEFSRDGTPLGVAFTNGLEPPVSKHVFGDFDAVVPSQRTNQGQES